MKKHKYITSKHDVMGGMPCIAGTRIPLEVILYRLRDGYSLKELHKMYPWVSLKKLEGALGELAGTIERLNNDQKVFQTQAPA